MRYIVEKGVSKDNIHVVGLSLGSHIAGYIGKEVPGIGRITGNVVRARIWMNLTLPKYQNAPQHD